MGKYDAGNIAWVLISTGLVMFMTPGLALFYGGMVRAKNVLGMLMQNYFALGIVSILWAVVAYSLAFGGTGKYIGNLDFAFMKNVDTVVPAGLTLKIPPLLFCVYQLMFAIITPALITGAFANRVTFKAYMLFLTAWLLLVYFPFVHMVWGGGILQEWGVKDFAGGIVVHNIAGIAALASVLFVGKRRFADKGLHSIPLVALGTGLLWFGWYGFNAGSEFRADSITALAFLNTDLSASFAAVAWLAMDWFTSKKPKFLGLLTGAVAGLATITPCAGYVTPTSAAIIGIAAGIVCYFAVSLKNRFRWDDALDVWGVHGVGGALGVVLLGLMGSTAVNSAGADGLFRGNAGFFWKQVLTVVGSSIYAFGFTFVMLWIINKVTVVRTTEGEEERGLDEVLHGESAYEGGI